MHIKIKQLKLLSGSQQMGVNAFAEIFFEKIIFFLKIPEKTAGIEVYNEIVARGGIKLMSAFDRRMQILKKLICYNAVKRTELALEFDVSDDTIGRDLRYLERYVPIASKLGRYGYIYIVRNNINKYQSYLSEDELSLLERLEQEAIGQDKGILQRIIQKFVLPDNDSFI